MASVRSAEAWREKLREGLLSVQQIYVTDNGRILSPGKFQGERTWVAVFWTLGLFGFLSDSPRGGFEFTVGPDELAVFPDLAGITEVELVERFDGFVSAVEYVDFDLGKKARR